jgi:hypothetical protein
MDRASAAAARIREIEAQQDELLRKLEALERKSEQVLARHLPAPPITLPVESATALTQQPDAT